MRKYFSILMLLAVLAFTACSSDSGTKPSTSTTNNLMPSKLGNTWYYSYGSPIFGGVAKMEIVKVELRKWSFPSQANAYDYTTYMYRLTDKDSKMICEFFVAMDVPMNEYFFSEMPSYLAGEIKANYRLSTKESNFNKKLIRSEERVMELTLDGKTKTYKFQYFDTDGYVSKGILKPDFLSGIGMVGFKYGNEFYHLDDYNLK